MGAFGENLRRERELRGISLREIADATKISIRFLEALERDRIDLLPGGVFRRAFVREYAKHLGLDCERVVADFLHRHGDPEGDATRNGNRGGVPNRGALVVVAFVVVLVPLVAGKAWREHRAEGPPQEQPAAPVARVYSTPAPAAPAEPEVASGLAITLSASEDCWVAVRADGETVLNRVLARGESETVEARGELVLSVGNAGGIAFSVGDKPGVPLGRAGEVRRNIVITRESLPSLVEDAPRAASAHSS